MRLHIYETKATALRCIQHKVIITSEVNGGEYWTETVIEVAEPIVAIDLEEIPDVPNASLDNPSR